MKSTLGSVGCGSILWGIANNESWLRAELLAGKEECDGPAEAPAGSEYGVGLNEADAEEKNARLVDDVEVMVTVRVKRTCSQICISPLIASRWRSLQDASVTWTRPYLRTRFTYHPVPKNLKNSNQYRLSKYRCC